MIIAALSWPDVAQTAVICATVCFSVWVAHYRPNPCCKQSQPVQEVHDYEIESVDKI